MTILTAVSLNAMHVSEVNNEVAQVRHDGLTAIYSISSWNVISLLGQQAASGGAFPFPVENSTDQKNQQANDNQGIAVGAEPLRQAVA